MTKREVVDILGDDYEKYEYDDEELDTWYEAGAYKYIKTDNGWNVFITIILK